MPLLRRCRFKRGPVAHEHDLACTPPREQFVRVPRLGKGKPVRDEWFDLLLSQKVEQGDQILSKPCGFQSCEHLDAVRDHPFPPWENPAADNIQSEDGGSTKALTTTWTTRTQSLSTDRGNETIAHHLPPGKERRLYEQLEPVRQPHMLKAERRTSEQFLYN